MTPRDWLQSGRPQLLFLWGAALLFVALALADIALLGIDPATLAIIAAVIAAVSSVYRWNHDTDGTD